MLLNALDGPHRPTAPGDPLATAKREALLLFTHGLRTGRRGLPPEVVNPAAHVVEFWFQRAVVKIDPAVDTRKTTSVPFFQQGRDAILRWGWLALVLDPAYRGDRDTDVSWISGRLTEAGYPLHHILFHVVHATARCFDPDHPLKATDRRFAHDVIWNETFLAKGEFCRRFAANALRMGARLDDPQRDLVDIERTIARLGLPAAPGQT